MRHLLWNCIQINVTGPYLWKVNFGSGNSLLKQAASHYLSQYWPRSMSPNSVTRPQWVYMLWPCDATLGYKSWSSLFQTPSQYLNQCWLTVSENNGIASNWNFNDYVKTRRLENDNTPQPLDQWTNSPFMGQQVGNWSICHALWAKRKPIVHPTLYPTHISFIPSQSTFPFLKYGYQKFDVENPRSRSWVQG